MDPETMRPVSPDGASLGEVMMRGNVVMKGYLLKDAAATDAAFNGGWFHTGDLAVKHPDGYIQLKDRSKDIISGGENISSIEVEDALYKHPAVAMVGVVAGADEKWGETPCALRRAEVGRHRHRRGTDRLRQAASGGVQGAAAHRLAEIPKTSTGKIQKHVLRSQAKEA